VSLDPHIPERTSIADRRKVPRSEGPSPIRRPLLNLLPAYNAPGFPAVLLHWPSEQALQQRSRRRDEVSVAGLQAIRAETVGRKIQVRLWNRGRGRARPTPNPAKLDPVGRPSNHASPSSNTQSWRRVPQHH